MNETYRNLIIGFTNDSGNFILYTYEELHAMYRIMNQQQDGGTVSLIREIRSQHGISLKNAKDFVDSIRYICDKLPAEHLSIQNIVARFIYRE